MLAKLFDTSKDIYGLIDRYLDINDKKVIFITLCRYDLIDLSSHNTSPTDELYLSLYDDLIYYSREKEKLYSDEFIEKSMWSDIKFSMYCAKYNHVKLLKYWYEFHVRNHSICSWGPETLNTAAKYGNLEILKYAISELCPYDIALCNYAAKYNKLNVLHWLMKLNIPFDDDTFYYAAYVNNLEMVKYLASTTNNINYNGTGYYGYQESIILGGIVGDHVDIIKYMVEEYNSTPEILRSMCEESAVRDSINVIKYLYSLNYMIDDIYTIAKTHNSYKIIKWLDETGIT